MNKKYMILAGLLLSVLQLGAQEWEYNINNVRRDSIADSYAEVYGKYATGEFRRMHEGPSIWGAGVSAEGYMHHQRFSVSGRFGFEHQTGANMCGSMLTDPDLFPIDIIEFIPGRKDRQDYSFGLGLSADMGPEWKIGAAVDFTSTNYSKRKDLRYTNFGLDFSIAPSVLYDNGDVAVGASYVFHRKAQSIKAEELGIGEETLNVFLKKGWYYGTLQSWDGNGVHLNDPGINRFPIVENSHTLAAQLGIGSFYIDGGFTYAKGKAGEKDDIWFDFPSTAGYINMSYCFEGDEASHYVSLRGDISHQRAFEHVLDKVSEGGVTITKDFGKNQTWEESVYVLTPCYEFEKGDFIAGLEGYYEWGPYVSSVMYPYMIRGNTIIGELWAYASYSFPFGLDVEMSVGCFNGKDTYTEEGEYPDALDYLEELDGWETEYWVVPGTGVTLDLQYNFLESLYVRAGIEYKRVWRTPESVPGVSRTVAGFGFGYCF